MQPSKYKNTELGPIPEDWEVKKMSELTSLMTNGFVGPVKSHYTESDNGVTYIQGYNVLENSFNFNGIKRITHEFHNLHLKSCLKVDDLLTIQTGDVGLTSIVTPGLEGANCHALIISRIKNKKSTPKYFSYYLNSKKGRARLKEIEVGTTMKHINVGDLLDFLVPVPRNQEQKAIATALSDTDALVSSLEQLISKKRAIKQGAMQELLKPKEGWEVKKLGEIVTFLKGKGLPKSDLKVDGKYRCIHYGELFTKYNERITKILSYTDYNSNCFYSQANDILMPTSDVTPYGLATASCVKEDNIILGGDILVIRPISGNLDGLYLAYYISQNKRRIMKLVTGSTVYHLYGSSLNDFKLNYPDIKEQIRITSIISNMDTEIENLERKLHKYKQIKQGMMQQLLTGKIRLV